MLERSIRLVAGNLCTTAARTGSDEVNNVSTNLRPNKITTNEFQGLVLAWVSAEYVVVLVSEYAESKVVFFWYIDAAVESCWTVI